MFVIIISWTSIVHRAQGHCTTITSACTYMQTDIYLQNNKGTYEWVLNCVSEKIRVGGKEFQRWGEAELKNV